MDGRSPLSDEGVLRRWMQLELGRINNGIAAERKTLGALLREEIPATRDRAGREYPFDLAVIQDLGARLPAGLHDQLRLPVLFYASMDVPGSCFLADPVAVRALQHLGEISPLRAMQDGRLWVGKPLVYAMLRRYPTAIQVAVT